VVSYKWLNLRFDLGILKHLLRIDISKCYKSCFWSQMSEEPREEL